MPDDKGDRARAVRSTLSMALGKHPHTGALRDGADLVQPRTAWISPTSRRSTEHSLRWCASSVSTSARWRSRPFCRRRRMASRWCSCRWCWPRASSNPLSCAGRTVTSAAPRDLTGRRVGVRAYSQTTGIWLRGILADMHDVRPDEVRWVTFEDAHVAEVPRSALGRAGTARQGPARHASRRRTGRRHRRQRRAQ